MSISVHDYAGRTRDSRWERDLAQELRKLPEAERLAFIIEFATANPAVALELARKSLSERHSFEALLDQALVDANSSGMRYWLESIVPHLGFRRVVASLRRKAISNPAGVKRAAYWLPSFHKLQGFCRADIEALTSI
jgi:hypothetical protein